MKKRLSLYILACAAIILPALSSAADFSITQTSNEVIGNSFRVQYSVPQAPATVKKIHLWVGEYSKIATTWISQNKVVQNLPTGNAGYPKTFAAEMDFTTLGITPGIKYAYALTDRNSGRLDEVTVYDPNNAELLEVHCFTKSGPVACKEAVVNPVVVEEPTPSPESPVQPEPPIQPEPPVQPQQPVQPTPSGGQNAYIGGMYLFFHPNDQQLFEDSALLKGTISAQLEIPVDIEIVSGPSPSQINQSYKPILEPVSANQKLLPGDVKTFKIPFTNLTKGTTYYFLVKNNATGLQSPVWNFTTKGGTAPIGMSATTIFDNAVDPYGDPGSFEPVVDTISDKGIVPKCGRTQNAKGTIPVGELAMCTAKDFMQLVANVIQYALIIIGPIIAVVVMYSGAMILWLNYDGDPSAEIEKQKKKYFGILGRAAIGVGIVLIAWVLVATLIKELGVKPEFVLLDLFSSK